jgi:hypothetical protein
MARGVPDAGPPAALFLRANAARQLVGISVGIGSNRRGKLLQVQMVIGVGACRPGAPSTLLRSFGWQVNLDLFGRSSRGCRAQFQLHQAMQNQLSPLVDGLADFDALCVPHHETFAPLVCWCAAVEPRIGSRL